MKKKLAITGISLLAASILSGCGAAAAAPASDPAAHTGDQSQDCIGGYEGPWNSTRVDGTDEGWPREIVTVLTDSGRIIDAFNRDKDATGTPEELGITYEVKMDKTWPANSVVIMDTSNGKVIDTFPIQPGEVICD